MWHDLQVHEHEIWFLHLDMCHSICTHHYPTLAWLSLRFLNFESNSKSISIGCDLWFTPYGAPPWVHHVFLAWSSCGASLLAHRFKTTSILAILLLWWCLSPFSTSTTPCNLFVRGDLTHRPPLSSIQSYFPLGRWPLMLESLSRVFPLEIPPTQHIQNYIVTPWFVN